MLTSLQSDSFCDFQGQLNQDKTRNSQIKEACLANKTEIFAVRPIATQQSSRHSLNTIITQEQERPEERN